MLKSILEKFAQALIAEIQRQMSDDNLLALGELIIKFALERETADPARRAEIKRLAHEILARTLATVDAL